MDVQAQFPLTTKYLGRASPAASSPAEYVRAVCAAHAKGDIPSRAARDLAHYEALLLEVPSTAPPVAPLPKDDAPCVLAPHARLHVFGADLPRMVAALRAGAPATPRPARGWIVLLPGTELVLVREEGWFLESFREPTPPAEAIEDDEDRALFEKLWRLGALSRSPPSPIRQ